MRGSKKGESRGDGREASGEMREEVEERGGVGNGEGLEGKGAGRGEERYSLWVAGGGHVLQDNDPSQAPASPRAKYGLDRWKSSCSAIPPRMQEVGCGPHRPGSQWGPGQR